MKKILLSLMTMLAMAVSMSASAGNDNGPSNVTATGGTASTVASPVANGGTAIAQGGQGGSGIGVGVSEAKASVVGSGNSSNSNTNLMGQLQGQIQGIAGSGNSSLSGSNNSDVSTSLSVGGDTTKVERSAPAVFTAATSQPIRSCRLTAFGGGSTVDGSASGGIPIGNDQTCLSEKSIELMERVGGFTVYDKQLVLCKIEGMGKTDTCKGVFKKYASANGYDGDDSYVIARMNR